MKNINTKFLAFLLIILGATFLGSNISFADGTSTCDTNMTSPCVSYSLGAANDEFTALPGKTYEIKFSNPEYVPDGPGSYPLNMGNIQSQILKKINDESAIDFSPFSSCKKCLQKDSNGNCIKYGLECIKFKNKSQNSIKFPKTYVDIKYVGGITTVKIIDGKGNNIGESLVGALNFAIELCNLLFAPLLMFAGWLLTPDWTVGDFIGIRPALHSLWILMFNLVYVIFAFLFIYIAILNVFKEGKDSYAIKAALPRLVIALLIVPFSWFGVQAVLSISNILTAAILQVPKDTLESLSGTNGTTKMNGFLDSKRIPKNIIYLGNGESLEKFSNKKVTSGTVNVAGKTYSGNFYRNNLYIYDDCSKPDSPGCYSIRQILDSGSSYNILMAYAYGVFNIGKISQLVLEDNASIGDYVVFALGFAQKVGVWALFFIVFLMILLALVIALMKRAFYLWLYVIFSPFFALSYFFNGKLPIKDNKTLTQIFSFKEFVTLALVPVYVSVALSLGFIFLGIAGSHMGNIDQNTVSNNFISCNDNNTNDLVCSTKMGSEINFAMKGDGKGAEISKVFDSFKDGGLNTIQSLILSLLGIVILWMAVMAALKHSEITKNAIKEISDSGDAVGRMLSSLPKHAPIPIPGVGSVSLASMPSITGALESQLRNKSSNMATDIQQRFTPMSDEQKELQKLGAKSSADLITALNNTRDTFKNIKDPSKIASDHVARTAAINQFNELVKQGYFKDNEEAKKDITRLESTKDANEIKKLIIELNNNSKNPSPAATVFKQNLSLTNFDDAMSNLSGTKKDDDGKNNNEAKTDPTTSKKIKVGEKDYEIKTYMGNNNKQYVKKSELPDELKNKTATELGVNEIKN